MSLLKGRMEPRASKALLRDATWEKGAAGGRGVPASGATPNLLLLQVLPLNENLLHSAQSLEIRIVSYSCNSFDKATGF